MAQSYALSLITPRAQPLVTVPEAKLYLREVGSNQDDVIEGLIEAATVMVEHRLQVKLGAQTWRMTASEFYLFDRLPIAPVTSISEFNLRDASGGYGAIDLTALQLLDHGIWQSMAAAPGLDVPAIDVPHAAAYRADLVVGIVDVPKAIITAINMLVTTWFDSRGARSTDDANVVPFGVDALLARYRRFT